MPELDFKKDGVPSKQMLDTYLNTSQIYPLNARAIGFELLKLIDRVNKLEEYANKEKN